MTTCSLSRFFLKIFQRAQALAQHHDAVTGTSKQHVANDYAQRLDKARVRVEAAVSSWLSHLAFGRNGSLGQEEALPELVQCRLMNVSICDATSEVQWRLAAGFLVKRPQRRLFITMNVSPQRWKRRLTHRRSCIPCGPIDLGVTSWGAAESLK